VAAEENDESIKLTQVLLDEHAKIHGEPDYEYKAETKGGPPTLPAVHRLLQRRDQWALCLSGGGIRSATFGLGVIDGLAELGLLEKFHYLSTVSGGGYLGSWLTSWIHRHKKGLPGVIEDLNKWVVEPAKPNDGSDHKPPIQPEPDPIRHLRKYSNYLTPKLGALSADSWTGVATYLRNLVLVWLVLLPLLVGALLVPKFAAGFTTLPRYLEQRLGIPRDAWIGITTAVALLLGVLLLIRAIYVVGANRPSSLPEQGKGTLTGANRPSSLPEQGKGTLTQGQFIRRCLVPALVAAVALSVAWAWLPNKAWCILPGRDDFLSEGGGLLAIVTFAVAGIVLRCFAWLFWAIKVIGKPADSGSGTAAGSKAKAHPWFELVIAAGAGLIGGVIIWFVACVLFPDPLGTRAANQEQIGLIAAYVTFSAPAILVSFLTSETLYVGLSSFYTSDDDREWWGRSGAWLLIAVVGWTALAGISLYGPALLVQLNQLGTQWVLSTGGLAGVAGLAATKLGGSTVTSAAPGKTNPALAFAMAALPFIFIVVLLAFLGLAADWVMSLGHAGSSFVVQLCLTENISLAAVAVTAVALALICLPMSYFVNINRFSLHAMYRYRIIRAYPGASNLKRNPNRFTGFDQNDNIYMQDLWPGPRNKRAGLRQPFHVVNIALNLVSGSNYAWQERKAAPFTVTPLHSGSWYIGYQSSAEYGNPDDGISLGTAVAISGAAASPNMGYHSSPAVSFLMTLFNVRLGWWLGNPRKQKTIWQEQGPNFMVTPLLQELFGLTNWENPYIYLSDGGHFDNLGLYEMVLRRCRLIVVSDASADEKFEFFDLGMAIRKIRIDLGVEIEMGPLPVLLPREKLRDSPPQIDRERRYAAVGRILYPEGEPGYLIYLKPGIYGNEPADVQDYAVKHKAFPHDTTADQWFDESQFESYRRLGQFVIASVFGTPSDPTPLPDIIDKRSGKS
jgi:hypothetical protein